MMIKTKTAEAKIKDEIIKIQDIKLKLKDDKNQTIVPENAN